MRLKGDVLGCAAGMLLLLGIASVAVAIVMTPRTSGRPLSNAELKKFVEDNVESMRVIRMLALDGDVEEASRLATGLGFLSLTVERGGYYGRDAVVVIAVYEQTDYLGGYVISLDYPVGARDRQYQGMTREYGGYTPCPDGWWVVRH